MLMGVSITALHHCLFLGAKVLVLCPPFPPKKIGDSLVLFWIYGCIKCFIHASFHLISSHPVESSHSFEYRVVVASLIIRGSSPQLPDIGVALNLFITLYIYNHGSGRGIVAIYIFRLRSQCILRGKSVWVVSIGSVSWQRWRSPIEMWVSEVEACPDDVPSELRLKFIILGLSLIPTNCLGHTPTSSLSFLDVCGLGIMDRFHMLVSIDAMIICRGGRGYVSLFLSRSEQDFVCSFEIGEVVSKCKREIKLVSWQRWEFKRLRSQTTYTG